MILHYLLISKQEINFLNTSKYAQALKFDIGTRTDEAFKILRHDADLHPSILHICRQLALEGIPILYGHNRFNFNFSQPYTSSCNKKNIS